MLVIEEKQQVASINVVTPTEFEAIYVAGVEPTSIFTSSICKLIFMFTKEFEAIDVYKRTSSSSICTEGVCVSHQV